MEDVADIDLWLRRLSAGAPDIRYDQVETVEGTRCGADRHESGRARRAFGRELDDPKVAGAVIDVERKPRLLQVERLRKVDIPYRDHHQLQPPVHATSRARNRKLAVGFVEG